MPEQDVDQIALGKIMLDKFAAEQTGHIGIEGMYAAALVAYDEIDLAVRGRIEYGDVLELSKNIEAVGLINRIVVVDKSMVEPETLKGMKHDVDKNYLLLAGGRRMKALSLLKMENVPCNVSARMLSEYEIQEIELYENTQRLDLTETERIFMTEKLHNIWTARHGGVKKSTAPGAKGHTIADTARSLKRAPSSVAGDLRMADLMRKMGITKDMKINMSTLKKVVATAKNKVQAIDARVAADNRMSEVSKDVAKFQEHLSACYKVGDALVECAKLPDETFDLIEIDPPFAQDLNVNKAGDSVNISEYTEIPKDEYEAFMRNILQTSFAKAKADAWLVCWFAPYPWYTDVARWIEEAGWKIRPIPLIWVKEVGQTNQPSMYLATNMEMAFYARKGAAKLVKQGRNSTYEFKTVSSHRKIHSTEKPANMLLDLFGTFVHENSKILVPFLGSGASILAASDMGCEVTGFDLSTTTHNKFIAERVAFCEPRRCSPVQFLSLAEVRYITNSNASPDTITMQKGDSNA